MSTLIYMLNILWRNY